MLTFRHLPAWPPCTVFIAFFKTVYYNLRPWTTREKAVRFGVASNPSAINTMSGSFTSSASGTANQRVVADRLDWVQRMVEEIRSLPLGSLDEFISDRRNIGAAESCLRRALEALLDFGRHLLAKVFGEAVSLSSFQHGFSI